jgi:aminomethyltransferase
MLRETPLHPRTSALCQGQNWRRWAGHVVASSYELQPQREYHAIRSAAALIDVSPLFKYRIAGPDAARLLDTVVTRDVSRCAVGQVLYTPWCDPAGKVIDDGTISRLDEELFRLTAAEPNLRWLHLNADRLRVSVKDESETVAALALQGPLSRDILNQVADPGPGDLRFFRLLETHIDGAAVTITRTGYTGDLGYEIWTAAADALRVWDAVTVGGGPYGLTPAGMLALDIARIEAGLLLISVDYVSANHALIPSQLSSPFELGLGWTVKLEKEHFVGRPALLRERERGARWHLRGLEVDWESLERVYSEFGLPPQIPGTAWRRSVPIYSGGKQVGYATSGTWSPTLKKYVALAHLQARYAEPGTELAMEVTAEHHRRRADARVVTTPFFDPARKRA